MATPSIPVEDQDDEDFFDKLVDDEVVTAGSDTDFKGKFDNDGAQVFVSSSVDEVDTDLDSSDKPHNIKGDSKPHSIKGDTKPHSIEGDAKTGGKDDITSCELDCQVENMGVGDGGVGTKLVELVEPKIIPKFNEPKISTEFNEQKIITESNDHADGVESSFVAESAFDSMICSNDANTGGGIKEVQWSAFSGGIGEASYCDFFSGIGDSSGDPFGPEAGGFVVASDTAARVSLNQAACSSSYSFVQNKGNLQHVSSTQQSTYGLQHGSVTEMQDQNSIEYWENLYPGWKYDANTGQWYQLDSPDNASAHSIGEGADVHYFQQTAQSVAGCMSEAGTTDTLSHWNQASAGSMQYPAHMLFDPEYPGWYYDTIAQEWRALDSYISSISQSVIPDFNQQMSNGSATGNYYSDQTMIYGQLAHVNSYSHLQDQLVNRGTSATNYQQQDMSMAQPESFGNSKDISCTTQNTHSENGSMSRGQYSVDHGTGVTAPEKSTFYGQPSEGFDSGSGFTGFQGFKGVTGSKSYALSEQFLHYNQRSMEFGQQFSPAYFNGQKVPNFSQQPLQNSLQPCVSSEGRSSAGRPPHALVAFGFGGKLIVMKDQSILQTQPAYASQDSPGVMINVFNMMEVALPKSDGADAGFSACDYFCSLCQQSFPGPLVSGNVGAKELNKWVDDRIANCATQVADYRNGETLKMLFCVLKIACHFYGKLRSAFGTDLVLKENDCPESALAKLFSSAKGSRSQFSMVKHCLQSMPSQGQIQATADEVQMLLVSGRRMEALHCAQVGQLWGPAIVIAALLGDQFYGETVRQMALHQLVAGSPLRTLCLLLAGQPGEVFSNTLANNLPSGVNVSQPVQAGFNCLLDEWEENLAIITANRTQGDELVITHLGDCLWKERGEVTAAHICYLVAEANIESYSESARLCLVGADHLKYPRTYATPEAIQRTELYECAKVLGNSQFILLPFQPYKLVYASMLAEVGKLTDSLKYCQAVLKSLKAGRSTEVDAWRHMVFSLEERIKIHQQGGYATNLAPTKFVGKLLNFFDNTAHRVVGGLPPPIPSPTHGHGQHIEHNHQSRVPQISTSQSTMAMSSLMPSASMEMDGSNRKLLHNRSISEPDIGRTPRKDESPEKPDSSGPHDNTSAASNPSRFGLFGSQLFQKTIGLVLRSRPDRQAKLGEKNKFYYDEKLKRWVEEGAEPPAEEPVLAPPPTGAAFMNGTPDHDKKDEFVNNNMHKNGQPELKGANSFEKKARIPPLPSGASQFSARGRMGVRARYVDTFNKGGGALSNLFHSPSPSVPAKKPPVGNAKFFIPTPVASQETDTTQNTQEAVHTDEDTTTSDANHSLSSPQMLMPPSISPASFHRHPSMEELLKGPLGMTNGNGNVSSPSRRTSSWSEGLGNIGTSESRSPGEAPGLPPPPTFMPDKSPSTDSPGVPPKFMPDNSPSMPFSSSSGTLSEDLQEVQL